MCYEALERGQGHFRVPDLLRFVQAMPGTSKDGEHESF